MDARSWLAAFPTRAEKRLQVCRRGQVAERDRKAHRAGEARPAASISSQRGCRVVNLQEFRHSADYDPLRRFNRADTIIEVGRAEGLADGAS